MSNARKPAGAAAGYRNGYLRSAAWAARRRAWIATETRRHGTITCPLCTGPIGEDALDLHHLDYTGVIRERGVWLAREHHDDLIGMHPRCHDWLHRLMDSDTAIRRMRNRHDATRIAIYRLRARLRRTLNPENR